MHWKRGLIAAFALLSLIAVWDMVRSGPSSFGSILDQTAGQIDWDAGGEPVRAPDYAHTVALDSQEGVRSLVLDPTVGNLEIVPSETGAVSAAYTVRVWGSDRAEAVAREVQLKWERTGERLRLAVDRPERLPPGIQLLRLDVRLAVPQGVAVAATHRGSASVRQIAGSLTLEHEGGSATVHGVQGAVTVKSRLSQVAVSEIAGDLTLEQSAGQMTVRAIDGSVTAALHLGELTIMGVRGGVDVRGNYGEVEIAAVEGNIKLDMTMGEASVSGLKQAGDLAVRFGDLEVKLAGEGGWTVDGLAEMGEIRSNVDLERRQRGSRTELRGTIGDGTYPLTIRVQQGDAQLIQSW